MDKMITFKNLLIKAKSGDRDAQEKLLCIYNPLLIKNSIVDGEYDEDLYQELCLKFIMCLKYFEV